MTNNNKLDENIQNAGRKAKAGFFLRQQRLDKSLSLQQASTSMNISINYLSEIERGLKIPSNDLIEDLSCFYEIDRHHLYHLFGRIPQDAQEELESTKRHQMTLSEISKLNLSIQEKEELYEEIHRFYQSWKSKKQSD